MHWKHSNFQVAAMIIGNCHTYDEAYRIVCELEEDRDLSIDLALAESKRAQSKVVSAKETLKDKSEGKAQLLISEANVAETAARKKVAQPCLDEGRRELAFLRMLKEKLNEYRVYKNLPDYEAHQLCQPLEWQLDLVWKAYNHLAVSGGMPYDHLMLIKMHPAAEQILTTINALRAKLQTNNGEFFIMQKQDVFGLIDGLKQEPIIGLEFMQSINIQPDTTALLEDVKAKGISYYESGEDQP